MHVQQPASGAVQGEFGVPVTVAIGDGVRGVGDIAPGFGVDGSDWAGVGLALPEHAHFQCTGFGNGLRCLQGMISSGMSSRTAIKASAGGLPSRALALLTDRLQERASGCSFRLARCPPCGVRL